MSVVIRLKRYGSKKKPFYRIVVCKKTMSRDARPLEEIGHYDPKANPAKVEINAERAKYWLKSGARPSATVGSILKKKKIT